MSRIKIWIIGKYGIMAKALQKACKELNIEAEASAGSEVSITEKRELEKFCQGKGFTHVINCAAFTAVDLAEREKEQAYSINALGPEILGNLCREKNIHCIHLSTDYVFDGKKKSAYLEEDSTHPLNTYGYTKSEGEKRLLAVNPQALIIRTSWIFSETGHHFLKAIIKKALNEKTLMIADDQTGRPTYAKDLAHAILDTLNQTGVFHFANQHEVSRYEYAEKIIELMRELKVPVMCEELLRGKTKVKDGIALRPSYSALDTTKIEKILKKPIRGYEVALKECIQILLEKGDL